MIVDFKIDTSGLRNLPPAEPIRSASTDLLAAASGFRETVESLRNRWSALDTLYVTREREQVLSAIDRPMDHAEAHEESVSSVAKVLADFATELEEIASRTRDLEESIRDEQFRLVPIAEEMGNSPDGEGWDAAHEMVANAALPFQAKATALEERYERARAKCQAGLERVSRVSSHVVSNFDSPQMDLESQPAAELRSAYEKANGANATPEDVAAFYRLLADMGPAQVAAFAAALPDVVRFTKGLDAYKEASFWKELTPAQREGLTKSLPGLVGNLEGAPYRIRNEANRQVLDYVILHQDLCSADQLAAYLSIRDSLRRDGPEPKYLISFDPAREHPLAAIAVGYIDDVANATFLVPGMDSYTTNMGDLVDQATVLVREQKASAGASQAVIAYMGYDTPGLTDVTGEDHAVAGAQDFANALDGFYLTRTAAGLPAPHTNIVAHSYGTTMTTEALLRTLFPVNSAVFIGSAGVENTVTAEDLNVDRALDGRRDIYVSTADGDGLARKGITATEIVANYNSSHGIDASDEIRVDPTAEEWGGRPFGSNGYTTEDGQVFTATDKHDLIEYLKEDSSSLRGIVMATTGEGTELMQENIRK